MTNMRPDKDASWRLATDTDVDLQQLWTDSRAAWGQYGYLTTWGVANIAIHAISNLYPPAPEGMVNAFMLSEIPEDVYVPVSDRRRAEQAANDTLAWISGVQVEVIEASGKRDFERRLKAISRDYKGLDVYFFSWWTRACLIAIEQEDPSRLPAFRAALREAWDEY